MLYRSKGWGRCPQRRRKGWVLAMLARRAARGSVPGLRPPLPLCPPRSPRGRGAGIARHPIPRKGEDARPQRGGTSVKGLGREAMGAGSRTKALLWRFPGQGEGLSVRGLVCTLDHQRPLSGLPRPKENDFPDEPLPLPPGPLGWLQPPRGFSYE